MVDCTFPSWNYSGITFAFGYNDTVAGKYKQYSFGTYQNNSIQIPRMTVSNTNDASFSSQTARQYNWGTLQKMLVLISSRTGTLDSIKMRLFDNETLELPTFTPNYWDLEHQADFTNVPRLEELTISGSQNSGDIKSAQIDNMILYKAAPMSNYTTTGTVYGTATKYMTGDAVAPPLRIPNTIPSSTADLTSTISFDQIPDKNAAGQTQTVISQGWYNYSVNPPALISNTNSINIDNTMVGELIKAVVIVDANGIQTTYNPFAGFVRAAYDYTNQTATLSPKLNLTLASDWAKATSIDFKVNIQRNFAGNSAFSGTSALIVAQYASNGILKSINNVPCSKKLGSFFSAGTMSIIVSIPIIQSPANYASGDYFKAFAWISNVNSDGEFALDIISPLTFNANCSTRVNLVYVP